MEQKPTSFSESLAFGQEGEREVALELMRNGIYTMPLYQFTASMAPVIMALNTKHICPDLIGFCNGRTWFVESKRKQSWVRWEGLETGINLRHYEEYKALADATGIKVFLIFIQEVEQPTGMYMTEIHNTETRLWSGYGKRGYVNPPIMFFTSESLTRIK